MDVVQRRGRVGNDLGDLWMGMPQNSAHLAGREVQHRFAIGTVNVRTRRTLNHEFRKFTAAISKDVVRHPLVARIIEAYDADASGEAT